MFLRSRISKWLEANREAAATWRASNNGNPGSGRMEEGARCGNVSERNEGTQAQFRRRFEGRTIVVIGGARGIGGATARGFAVEGGAVVVADLLEAEGEATVNAIRAGGGEATFVSCDVSVPSQVEALVAQAVARYGGVDVLFNNVGIARYGKVEDLSIEDWDTTMATNLRGMFLACKFTIPEMRKRGGGVIVNTASALAHGSQALTAAYCASKGGVLALTRTIAIDHAAENIRCNSISPGTIDTPIVRIAATQIRPGHEDELAAEWGHLHPLGRMGLASEVANLVLFLASDDSSFITGSDYPIDGGIRAELIKA